MQAPTPPGAASPPNDQQAVTGFDRAFSLLFYVALIWGAVYAFNYQAMAHHIQ